MSKLLWAPIAGSAALLLASVASKSLGPSPAAVFEALLDRSTDRVSEFDGFVERGTGRANGYESEVRFRASEDWVAALPYLGFRQADCAAVRHHVKFSPLRVAAWPPWYPEGLEQVVCYERVGENRWSPNGRDYLLAEQEGGWVYFSGSGPAYDRAFPDAD